MLSLTKTIYTNFLIFFLHMSLQFSKLPSSTHCQFKIRQLLTLVILASFFLVAGCGQPGPLYLPNKEPAPVPPASKPESQKPENTQK